MSDPVALLLAIDADAARLDELEKLAGVTADAMERAEYIWLEVRDVIAEALKDEMVSEGRKGDPAEHTVLTAARMAHRVEFTNWRRAKRALETIDRQMAAKRAAMSGRQSELAALRDELNTGQRLAGYRDFQRKQAA